MGCGDLVGAARGGRGAAAVRRLRELDRGPARPAAPPRGTRPRSSRDRTRAPFRPGRGTGRQRHPRPGLRAPAPRRGPSRPGRLTRRARTPGASRVRPHPRNPCHRHRHRTLGRRTYPRDAPRPTGPPLPQRRRRLHPGPPPPPPRHLVPPGRPCPDAHHHRTRGRTMTSFEDDVERYRHELRVHCYRMLGSYDEAEDMVQETFLRAWRALGEFEGRSSVRAWLYRIATNACIDVRRPRRVLPYQLEPASFPATALPAREDVPWLQPFPDVLLDRAEEPDAVAIRRETIELAFLIAIQHLPARQRAVLIFRDVLGWSARETAAAVDLSVAAVNSALQRARPVLREHLPPHRSEWSARDTSEAERELLQRYLTAWDNADPTALAALMHEDIRITMPPYPFWFEGRTDALRSLTPNFRRPWQLIPTTVNRQPALAAYLNRDFFGLDIFRIEQCRIAEITAFETTDAGRYGLRGTMELDDGR
ncbi:sigma-70 family RNA polymerase sigma factor [Kribbella speibonae]|uniref:Sigma-70 family RNA polymerase sigma factor n=2 Tax=Kribbella speibonae TaxID=1572660 RepID=A0A4R0IAU7_9ACTN|nr:sigma-70 family RNA polymerase sigma factor [Kribbella speibonae]TCC30171.1 sigma-70 family RNA polymerase sigma factor [Kribbella speibonae]